MNVLFDGQIFVAQPTGGISRYYTFLAAGLNEKPDVAARIIAPLHRNEHLTTHSGAPVWGFGVPRHWRVGKISRLAMRVASPAASAVIRPDIVHETYYDASPYLSFGKRRVTTVYDMIHELYYPDDPTTAHKKRALARCEHVLCISQNTKKDLCELLDFPAERASVTHLAYDDFSRAIGSEPPSELSEWPYILFVGNRSGHKNFASLMQAFASLPRMVRDFRLACFGGPPLDDAERAKAVELGLPPEALVHLSGGDERLGQAYAHATAFVYPSLYEGFGIPPLEAMSAGCPVLSSNSSSLPEVVGDAALTFDPKDVDALREALDRVTQSDALRKDLIARGHQQRSKFSQERCVAETLAVYRGIL